MALTPKQETFCQNVASGLNHTEAYRQAGYGGDSSPRTINSDAYGLANRPHIIHRVAEIVAQRQGESAWTRDMVILRAARNADAAYNAKQFSASNGALSLIADVQGLKVHKIEHSGAINHLIRPEMDLAALEARIKRWDALLATDVIEGEGYVVDDALESGQHVALKGKRRRG
jgi:hypothetical protein